MLWITLEVNESYKFTCRIDNVIIFINKHNDDVYIMAPHYILKNKHNSASF
jgi:hypothetical protein